QGEADQGRGGHALGPQAAAVVGHGGPADGQAHAETGGLGGEERLEQAALGPGGEPGTVVRDDDTRPYRPERRPDLNLASLRRDRLEGADRVLAQVHHDLLALDAAHDALDRHLPEDEAQIDALTVQA